MIKRYRNASLEEEWGEAKFKRWQDVELAVVKARQELGRIPENVFPTMDSSLRGNPIDIQHIDKLEADLGHDLIAFLEERMRFLSEELKKYFHKLMTSYDTEESAFVITLKNSCRIVLEKLAELKAALRALAIIYRFTPMNARTHGQEAEMQSFGKRVLTWFQDLSIAEEIFQELGNSNLLYSKLSGAIGTNSGIDPELEKAALRILGLKPWPGATQIMPRILYTPIADSLDGIALVIDKIAMDIRLGARSGRPLWQEPFGKKQKGSSAMPHKKNTIISENTHGMAVMAESYAEGIKKTIATWEERDIGHSSVERVFWPDLFHVVVRAIENLTKVIKGLKVYPDNMMMEILESKGTYASNGAKEFLAEVGSSCGLSREDTYKIVQLAAFNASERERRIKDTVAFQDLKEADQVLIGLKVASENSGNFLSIETIISVPSLCPSPQLDIGEQINTWNEKLQRMFFEEDVKKRWHEIFMPSHILKNEENLFKEVFKV